MSIAKVAILPNADKGNIRRELSKIDYFSFFVADLSYLCAHGESSAQLLLRQTNKSIKEIAAELHFPEQFTFRKFFKLHVGRSPKDYRTQK